MVTIDDMTLDVAISERHSGKTILTKHPVETGAKPADHARKEPDGYTVTGWFTNTPLDSQTQTERGLAEHVELSRIIFAKSMSDRLWGLLASHEAVTIETEMRKYENMVLVDLQMPRSAELGEVVEFSATFEQIVFVASETVRLQLAPNALPRKAVNKEDKSKQVATPTAAQRKKTILKTLKDTGVKLLGN